jgi:AcrR family transcriptional regulator
MRTRRSPTPREEGMANIVAATLEILDTTPPQDVTIRQVAEKSGHHHRLIVEWFGGKNELFAIAFETIFRRLIETGELYGDRIASRADVKKGFLLFNYGQMHDPEFTRRARTGFVVSEMERHIASQRNLSPEQAKLAARQLAIYTLGRSLFAPFFDLTEDDLTKIESWEIEHLFNSRHQ